MMKNKSGTIYAAFVLSQRDYYAYGQVMRGRTHESEKYRYAYNGKELEEDLGKGLTDFGGRILHTWGGFWLSVDPLASKYPMFSPYVSMGASPMMMVDLDGKRIFFIAGAGNDAIEWNYINRFQKIFSSNNLLSHQ
jgi:RHS repeat-associated protein